jgi:hypothetical protein
MKSRMMRAIGILGLLPWFISAFAFGQSTLSIPGLPGTLNWQNAARIYHGRGDCRLFACAPLMLLLLRRRRSGWWTLHAIERSIRCRQEFFNGVRVFRENGTADARRDGWTFSIRGDTFADSYRNLPGLRYTCLRKHHGKLVAPVSRWRVDLPAMSAQDLG